MGDINWQLADLRLPRTTELHTSLYGETSAAPQPNYDNWHAAAALDAARQRALMEHSGVLPHECPACAAHALNKRLALPVDETFTQAEGLAGKADEVMKGILDGTLSRPKVKQIGDAVTERTKKDGGSDALGGAIGRSNRHGSFMGRRTPYSD